MTTGLVLEGGAMRGLFTAGVLDYLLEEKVKFDGAVGVSAGAAFGVNYKSEQIGRTLRYNLRFAGNPRYASWKSWRQSGNLYGANFCYHILPEKLDKFDKETFVNNPMEFWSVATDAATGDPVYHLMRDGGYLDLEWVRASASIPVFAHPVAIRGSYYFDGGVSDSIPVDFAQDHYDKNLVVLTQPRDYRKSWDKIWPLEKLLLRKYPGVLTKLKTRSQDYNACLEKIIQEEKKGNLLVLAPPEALDIGTLEDDPEEIKRVYKIGYETAKQKITSIKKFLS